MIGLLRVKNEARWIERALSSILPLCDRVIVLDDNSDDDTVMRCAKFPDVCVFGSPFSGINEVRDKNYLLELVERSPQLVRMADWILMIDGDEELAPGGERSLRTAMMADAQCLAFRVLYLWDGEDQIRLDGVYSRFWRPSAFRFRPGLRFVSTNAVGFHCSNVPASLWPRTLRAAGCPLLHYGYMHRADRLRKYEWYNRIDPHNALEDEYRHMVIGDVFPAASQFRHGGPLQLSPRVGWQETIA